MSLLSDEISAELNSGKMPDLDAEQNSGKMPSLNGGFWGNAAYCLSPRPPIKYLVDKLIAEKSLSVWYGHADAKKTWAAVDLAVCVASGKQWLGMATEPCNVLIVDEESGRERLANRIEATLLGELGQLANESVPINFLSSCNFNLLELPDANIDPRKCFKSTLLLAEWISFFDAKLVIIDSLMKIMAGGDENAVKDTSPVFKNLHWITELTGAAIVVIHHANKLGGYRGSSAIAGAIDNLISVESKQNDGLIKFKTEKMRDGEPFSFAANANWTDEGFYLETAEPSADIAPLSKSRKFALDFFTEKGDGTLKQLCDYAGELYKHDALKKAVQYLVSMELLERKDNGGERVEAIYGIRKQ